MVEQTDKEWNRQTENGIDRQRLKQADSGINRQRVGYTYRE